MQQKNISEWRKYQRMEKISANGDYYVSRLAIDADGVAYISLFGWQKSE